MRIQYFGTGAGAGMPELLCSCRVCAFARAHGGRDLRTRSQAAVGELLIDFPLDAHAHALYGGLDMRQYRDVLITHDHLDHFCRQSVNSRFADAGTWRFYLPTTSAQAEKKRQEQIAASQTEDKQPPQRTVDIVEAVPFEPLIIGDYRVTPLPANHVKNIPCVLYLIQRGDEAVLWAHDTGLLPDDTVCFLRDHPVHLNAVSLDCTLKRGAPITPAHMDILQCRQTADLLRDINCAGEDTVLLLSHIGHLVERTHDELTAEAAAFGMIPAYNGMEIEV